jgi:hypothetical protein
LRPNIVLIDFESVQPASLEALAADHFRLKVFVGATQSKLPFNLVTAIQRMGERAEYIKIAGVGPNALDFHIAYYIGRIACDEPEAFFHVISTDTGFDPLIQHLKDRASLFLLRLLQPKATKPRTEKTLRSEVAAHFQRQLTEEEVSAVISALQAPGHISIAEGKVAYANAG